MNVFDKVISFKELFRGLKKSANGVMWKDSVANQVQDGLRNTYKLRRSLLDGSYKISEYQRFQIHEPKTRDIIATRIKDRQFQRSLCDNILTPQITKHFIYDNGACQKNKGVDFALNRMDAHLHRYYRENGCDGWVLRCDIKHYFPETLHSVAKAAVRKRVTDDRAYKAAADIIDSFGGDRGIGLGSQVSQLVQLSVLDDLDHHIKERLRIKHYIRYMDDFVLIHPNKKVLENALVDIQIRIHALGLELNHKTQLFPLRHGISFLQWHFILTETGKVVRKPSRSTVTRSQRRLKKIAGLIIEGTVPYRKLYESFQSARANLRRGNTYRIECKLTTLFNKLICEVLKNGANREQRTRNCKNAATAADCQCKGRKAGSPNCLSGDDDRC